MYISCIYEYICICTFICIEVERERDVSSERTKWLSGVRNSVECKYIRCT